MHTFVCGCAHMIVVIPLSNHNLSILRLFFSGFVLFTVIMFLASYVYEESTEKHMPAVSSDNSGQTIAGNNNTETLINPPDVILGCSKVVVEEKSFFERMAQCFSLRQNLKSLINVNAPPNAVSVVDGLK